MSKLFRNGSAVNDARRDEVLNQAEEKGAEELRTYKIRLEGTTPLIMHADALDQQARLDAWRTEPRNRALSVAGDDRSPPWTWQTYLYNDGEFVVIPEANIRACLMEAGKKCPKSKGRGAGSLKVEAVSGILLDAPLLPFYVKGKRIEMKDVIAIDSVAFQDHIAGAQALGFDVLVKRATIGQSKHIRARPVFRSWSSEFVITVVSDVLTKALIERIWQVAGTLVGLCDWRPGAKKSPGPYGQFKATIE